MTDYLASIRSCRAKLGLLWLERVREKFVCHTVPVTILNTTLVWKRLRTEHNHYGWGQHTAEPGREHHVHTSEVWTFSTYKKRTPEHHKWEVKEAKGHLSSLRHCNTVILQRYFYLLWKVKRQALGESAMVTSHSCLPHLNIILYCEIALLKFYHGIISTGLVKVW